MNEQPKEKFRYFPFLGWKKVHPMVVAALELDPKRDWRSFAFSWGWWEVYFAIWPKVATEE